MDIHDITINIEFKLMKVKQSIELIIKIFYRLKIQVNYCYTFCEACSIVSKMYS